MTCSPTVFKNNLIIGDIHAKPHIINALINYPIKFRRYIFLGDYADDWLAYPELNQNTIQMLIDFKHENHGKVFLLLGNHDLSEWEPEIFKCAGFNPQTSFYLKDLYSHKDFQIAYSIGNTLFTHAGVTLDWYNEFIKPNIKLNPKMPLATQISTYMNLKFKEEDLDFYYALRLAGAGRCGTSKNPSPIWADKDELTFNPIPNLNQIVGHTPIETATKIKIDDSTLYFCDTFSTSYYPAEGRTEPIGDNSCLVVKTKLKKTTAIEKLKLV